jgi:hypothetical protein
VSGLKVFGLELEQKYAELFISAMAVHSTDSFSIALAACSSEDISTLERLLGSYYEQTEILRESGSSNPHKEATACFFSASAVPVVTLFSDLLAMTPITLPNSILLAQYSYPDRNFAANISAARGYMVERLITQGNTWGTPIEKYIWLGDNYVGIAPLARELEVRGSVDKSLILELMRSEPSLASGSL